MLNHYKLQVVIAGLHYNPAFMLQTLVALQPADSAISIIDTFVKQMLYDTDCFLGYIYYLLRFCCYAFLV
jgi:hypothetical protein